MQKTSFELSNVYVVHGISGYEDREKVLVNLFKKHNLGYEFITESHSESENTILINRYFIDDIKTVLSKGAMFCTLVHFLIYERFLKSNNKYAVIFENDVCFLGSFNNKIKLVLEEADQLDDGFIISLENSTLRFPPIWKVRKGKYLYPAEVGRCAGAYLIDRRAAELMLAHLKNNKCAVVIDWWHNHLVKEKIIRMYWAHPPLTEQGSFNGKMPSSISVRNNGSLRSLKWSIQKFYKRYLVRLFRV